MEKCLVMVRMVLALAIFMLLWPQLHAQKAGKDRIDSLLARWQTMADDTNKVKLLNDVSFTYHTLNTDSGLAWGNNALALAIKLHFKSGQAGAYRGLCANYWAKHDYVPAQKCCFQSLQLYETLHDEKETARAIHNIGSIYESEYDFGAAMIYYVKALDLVEKIRDNDLVLRFTADIAEVLKAQKKYPEALRYFQKLINLSDALGRKRARAGYLARGGLVACENGDYILAMQYEHEALAILDTLSGRKVYTADDIAWTLRNFGTIYYRVGNYPASIFYFRKAYMLFAAEQGRFPQDNAGICLAGIGRDYLLQAIAHKKDSALLARRLNYAVDTLNRAVELLKPNDWLTLTQALQDLSAAQYSLANFAGALSAYKQYAAFKDSMYNTETEKKILTHQMEYEFARKKDSLDNINKLQHAQLNLLLQQQKLNRLQASQQWIYVAFVFTALFIIAFYFKYRDHVAKLNLQNELEKERIEKRLRQSEYDRNISQTTLTALISQMNPHFLFNALNTIQSFIYSNDKKNASSYLGKFSQLTRKVLDNSGKTAITLEEELELLHLYLDIEKSRFGDNFNACFDTDPHLNAEEILLPPMLIQPYVENAIKHGLLHKTGEKKLIISILGTNNGKAVEISIDDNGIGRDMSRELGKLKTGHLSFANAANEKRIDLINRALDKKIVLQIIDKKNTDGTAAGTRVIFIIPITKLP